MPECFAVGERYPRPELNRRLGGGGRMVGIIHTPSKPGVVICTSGGDFAHVAGFRDEPLRNGFWQYSGQQGGEGDPTVAPGNQKLRESKIVLLFTADDPTPEGRALYGKGKQYEYGGAFHVQQEKLVEQGEREVGNATWQVVGQKLFFILEPCDQQCERYLGLREQSLLA